MRYARIADEVVAEIINLPEGVDLAKAFHPSIVSACKEVGDDVQVGWTYDGDTFAPPPAPPTPDLDIVKAAAIRTMIGYADSITARITSRYPAAEVASWPTQEAEARIVLAGGTRSDAPLLTVLAAANQMELSDFAELVIDNATTYRQVIAAVQVIRGATEIAINAAQSSEAVDAALASAKEIAEAKAAELGLVAS